MPSHISSSLLRYKLNSSGIVRKELTEQPGTVNTDVKPVSFFYTFREILYSFGLMSSSLEDIFENMRPYWIYAGLVILCIVMINILRKSTVEKKIKVILGLSSYIFTLFVYDMTVSLQSNSGRIFRLIAMIWIGISLGFWTASLLFRSKDPRDFVAFLRVILMLTGVFLIILPAIYEVMLMPPPPLIAFALTYCGGILFGSIRFLGQRSCEVIYQTTCLPGGIYLTMVLGIFIACITSVIILPALGIADMLPAAGIISLSCVTLISI